MQSALADLGVLLITDVEAIVENYVTKWSKTLQSQIFKAVEFIFEEELQATYFNSNIGLKSNMFNVSNKYWAK